MENHDEPRGNTAYEETIENKLESEKIRRRSIIHEFCVNTTAHGLPSIANSTSLPHCLFWSVVFLGFAGLLIYFLVTAILAYYAYPTSIDIEIVSEWPQVFPAFSFCNYAPFIGDNFLQSFRNYSILNNLTNTNGTTEYQPTYNDIATFLISSANKNESTDPFDFPISAMLISCQFNNVPCSANNFIKFVSPDYGACYTFNAKLKNTTDSSLLLANQYGGDGVLSLSFFIHGYQYLKNFVDGKL